MWVTPEQKAQLRRESAWNVWALTTRNLHLFPQILPRGSCFRHRSPALAWVLVSRARPRDRQTALLVWVKETEMRQMTRSQTLAHGPKRVLRVRVLLASATDKLTTKSAGPHFTPSALPVLLGGLACPVRLASLTVQRRLLQFQPCHPDGSSVLFYEQGIISQIFPSSFSLPWHLPRTASFPTWISHLQGV